MSFVRRRTARLSPDGLPEAHLGRVRPPRKSEVAGGEDTHVRACRAEQPGPRRRAPSDLGRFRPRTRGFHRVWWARRRPSSAHSPTRCASVPGMEKKSGSGPESRRAAAFSGRPLVASGVPSGRLQSRAWGPPVGRAGGEKGRTRKIWETREAGGRGLSWGAVREAEPYFWVSWGRTSGRSERIRPPEEQKRRSRARLTPRHCPAACDPAHRGALGSQNVPPPPLAPVLDRRFLLSLRENVREGICAGRRHVSLLSLGPSGPNSSTSHTKPKALRPSRHLLLALSVYTKGAPHASVWSRSLGFGSSLRERGAFTFAHRPQFPHLQNAGLIFTCLVCEPQARAKSFPL